MPFDLRDRGKCRVCEIEIAKNRFYCDEHRPVETVKKAEAKAAAHARNKAVKNEPPKRPATAVSAARTVVQAGTPTTEARKRPPTAKEWSDKMGMALALLTTWLVLRIISRSDLAEAPDEVQDATADRLEMGEDEVDAIVDPFVALVTGPLGGLNKKYGRQSLEILGILPAVVAFLTWRGRLRDFEKTHVPQRPRRREQPRAQEPVGTDGEAPIFTPARFNGATVFEPELSGLVGPHPA